ncbi:general secretion pathway protein GspG [Serratia sp. Leaf50]|uniref:type II secretion system protein n=1 Tax=Rouxiella sp. S1S-2 TaxID=2653856 RepID=UPI0006F49DE5|nr:type II secretion system protein [Rouxiella sp. S1S-2]KAB7894659.1 prepilin-type N-terminal cleavage/methylation domain-containing protein [Rouxiella sp. S1S-2]KQN50525.1 general secretion pathway protein GspG [Serratia sp. Leaf50]
MSQRQKGFTLIEMMVTLTIMATLAAAALPAVGKYATRQKEQELTLALQQIREALDAYHKLTLTGLVAKTADELGYPKELSVLSKGVVEKTAANKKQIYLLRHIPRDPFCDCEGRSNEETWKLRSSTSEPGNFDGGKDVYDIRSSSTLVGSNGIPYAQW